jgi:oligopeptide/dipeptide ABC transporter ATP-binding protein
MSSDRDVPVDELEAMEPEVPADVPADAVLSVRGLRVEFPSDDGLVHAVDGVSFDVFENEVLGIVGESGSGKSVTSMAVMGLLPKRAQIEGEVYFRGRPIMGLPDRELRRLRGARIAMVFQDALTALNPVYTVGHQIAEAIKVHRPDCTKAEIRERAVELLSIVGIPNPSQRVDEYPHEYSGGMRQRAMIAMSIANEPDILIADEPTTALDVTIQAQVLEVMERIQERTRSAIVLITHDLGVVAGVADRVVVMYAGRAVEVGSVDQIFYEPHHPYTLGLLASLPRLDQDKDRDVRLHRIKGQPPSLVFVPPGCSFNPRCEFARLPDPCRSEIPELRSIAELDHTAACHFSEEVAKVRPGDLQGSAS